MHFFPICTNPAPGGPGLEPRWTRGAKDAVGTAYSASSRVWYTLAQGILNEVYYPTIDRPQIRDVQYLITDGQSFFHDERHHLESQTEVLSSHSLGARIVNSDPDGRYHLVNEVIADPHQACVLVQTRLSAQPEMLPALHLFVLCAPHLEIGGYGNHGQVVDVAGRLILIAHKHETWMALGATIPFIRGSCGYVGDNDGWQDLADNFALDSSFDCAIDGNIALTGELDLRYGTTFTLGIAFGDTLHNAVSTLFQSLALPFARHRDRFMVQWQRACKHNPAFDQVTGDEGALLHRSQSLLLAHEDKTYPGALIASLSIPWGGVKGDEELGGYHLVWTRDLVNSATGLLAIGNLDTPLRALIYLAMSQRPDGGFAQNFWIDGHPYWQGIQLDEVAFPILLAWHMHRLQALQDFDPYPMVQRATSYLIQRGPVTPQERWEEASGYSPSTLAATIAALTCAASWAHIRGEEHEASFIQEYADFLERHVEAWTVTTQGTLVPGISRHFMRIHPVSVDNVQPDEDPNGGVLRIANRAPWEQAEFPAKEIVDAGFLELVRYWIRAPGDRLIEDSLAVIDAVLKVETPGGPCWHRYNNDGYGEQANGDPLQGWGKGRAWPLLTGERGHYELAAGRSGVPFLRALEWFAHGVGLLPEQVWDDADIPERHLFLGRPTGSAMPLMWAHAEYIKLVRSTVDGLPFDTIPECVVRYQYHQNRRPLEIWKPNRQVRSILAGTLLRIQAPRPFLLRWTRDDWLTMCDTRSTATALTIAYADIPIATDQRAPIRFTFYWLSDDRWEGQDFLVDVKPPM